LKFAIFDVPQKTGGFAQRQVKAKAWFDNHSSSFAFEISQKILQDKRQLQIELQEVEALGGEGVLAGSNQV